MKRKIYLTIAVAAAGTAMARAQAPHGTVTGPPGESPGQIVMGPAGYFQKGEAQPGSGGRGRGGRGPGVPSASVRPADGRKIRTAVAGLLGWSAGTRADAFRNLTLSEAAGKVDALGLAFIEGSSTQKVSPEIQKNLDYSLTPDELAKVKNRLAELRLRMFAWDAGSLAADENSRRKTFEFAKGLSVGTIIADSSAAALPELERLADEFGINVALEGMNPRNVGSTLQGRGKRFGVVVDLEKWAQAGIKPNDGLAQIGDRLMVIRIGERTLSGAGGAFAARFLLDVARQDPPADPAWPPRCGNCTGYHVPFTKPLYISLDANGAADPFVSLRKSAEAFEAAVRPAMGYRVDEISRHTPISSPSFVHPEDRRKIEAALPRQAVVKPLRPRKLLVIDVTPNAYYHATCANGNLALELIAKYTGAYEPVFSNELDNLKYPKIRQFDAVFLNGIGGGEVFADPDVLNGLMRFVREGGGVAGLHGSTYASIDLPEYGEMMGGQDGNHRCCETSTMKIDDPDSPLTKAFGGKDFVWYDEFYHFPDTGPFSREKVHVLLSIDRAKTDLSEWKGVRADSNYASSWIRSYGKGRVFNCALGHTPGLFETPAFAQYMLAAIQFVLGDLKADTTPSAKVATAGK